MTMVKEVIDGLAVVAEAIENIRTISEAVREGKKYLETKHPEIKTDLQLMVDEIGKTMNVVAQASAVLTQFRFAVSADTGSSELARFNDYFIHHKGQAQFLRSHIDDLRGHCSKIREHAIHITGSASASGFSAIFHRLGLNSPQREQELGQKLDKLAYEDFEVANSAQIMLRCLDDALKDVQDALGDHGAMYPENVPKAAALLSEYAQAFEKLEKPARTAADDIRTVVMELE